MILDDDIGAQASEQFTEDLRSSRRVTLADVAARGPKDRLEDALFWWLRAQL